MVVTGLAGLSRSTPGETRKRLSFKDVAPLSEFSYISNNDFRGGRKYFPQPMCGGVAVLDFDNDGLMDLFFTNGAKLPELKKPDSTFHNALLRNKGAGAFEDVTAKAKLAGETLGFSFGAAAADYDNDGWTDLFVANAGQNTLYHNDGDGSFSDRTGQSGLATKPANTLSVQGAWFDYDNDGLLDLVVSDYTIWHPETDRICRSADVDMYCSPKTYPSVPQRLYRNLGGGRFEDVTEQSGFNKTRGKGMGIAIADFNGDNRPDVFIANDTERNLLFLNEGNGTFKEAGLVTGVAYNDSGATVSAMGADAKDYDNDGLVDIFYNNLMGQTWALFRNRDNKLFRYLSPATKVLALSQPFSGWSAGFLDYNNDGWKDVYSANGDVDNLTPASRQHDTLFENRNGGREFDDVSAQLGVDFLRPGYQRGAAFVDFDNDGFLDIVVTSLNERPRILRNSADNGANWLMLRLQGKRSNHDAIGAKLKVVTAEGRILHNHVSPSVGLLSSSDPRVHFGLGDSRRVSSVEVRWPSGVVQTLSDLTANQVLNVNEPSQ